MDEKNKRALISYDGKVFSCPTSVAMSLIGGKWKSVILIHLCKGKKRYSELRKLIPTISERALSMHLRQLEKDGLIQRKVHTTKAPHKVEYSQTDFGKSVTPTLISIAEWGMGVVEERGKFLE